MVPQANIELRIRSMATPRYTVTQQAIEEEWALIQVAQKNPARFAVLYNRYYEQIFRFIYNRTADEELCADLCAQTFLKAMQNLNKYTNKGVPFSAWLYRIGLNEINQYFRKSKKNIVVTLEENFVQNIQNELDNKEELEINIRILSKVIQLLKPEEVQLIELRYFEERSLREVGEIIGITENNAKVKVFRTIAKMKELFKKINRE